MTWGPTGIRMVHGRVMSSCAPFRVTTDAGDGYLKAIPSKFGPHCLACEVIGTRVARWLGLMTVEWVIYHLTPEDQLAFPEEDVPAGSVFLSKEVAGHTWGGSGEELEQLVNPDDLAGLVVLDTLLRNRDRYDESRGNTRCNLRNVFLADVPVSSKHKGRWFKVYALDQSDCLCGTGYELPGRLGRIEEIKGTEVFGCFPEFRGRIARQAAESYLQRLGALDKSVAMTFVRDFPRDWNVSSDAEQVVVDFLTRRAQFLVSHGLELLGNSGAIHPVLFEQP